MTENADHDTKRAPETNDGPTETAPARRGPPPNPLYHPLFLPVLLVAGVLWFGYDGFLTNDPDMQKHKTFNQVGFVVLALISARVIPRGIREFREDQEKAAKAQETGDSA